MRRREGEAKVFAASKRVSGWNWLMNSAESLMERSGGSAESGIVETDESEDECVVVVVVLVWVLLSDESPVVK